MKEVRDNVLPREIDTDQFRLLIEQAKEKAAEQAPVEWKSGRSFVQLSTNLCCIAQTLSILKVSVG